MVEYGLMVTLVAIISVKLLGTNLSTLLHCGPQHLIARSVMRQISN